MREPGVERVGPIRYARARRFARPAPVEPGAGRAALAVTGPGQLCPQPPASLLAKVLGTPADDLPQGEDCLYLSLTTPGRDEHARPVMVFFHGGAFTSGGGLLEWYDGGALSADADVVVVSANYRLGVFGWLCLDGVSEPNLGLHDQTEALRWVNAHIGEYGGDPANVTVFGQSAGAVSIRLLMEAPDARGLFSRAILQSGPGPEIARDRAAAEDIGRAFAAALGEDPRTATIASLLEAQRATVTALAEAGDTAMPAFHPVAGAGPLAGLGRDFPAAVRGLDVLAGWNADDVSAFTATAAQPQTSELTRQLLAEPITALKHRLNQAGATAFTYRLDWQPPGSPFGATHALELPLLLGTPTAWQATPMLGNTSREIINRFGGGLRRTWGHFAKTGTLDTTLTTGLPITWNPTSPDKPNFRD